MINRCRALVISCIDFRVQSAVRAYLEESGLGNDFDLMTVGGVARPFVVNTAGSREFLLHQIDVSRRLHDPCEVVLIPHEDCGTYGGTPAFASRAEEFDRYREDVARATELILARHPDLKVTTVFAIRTDDGFRVVDRGGIPTPRTPSP